MPRLRSHDQGFVAAAPGDVHAVLRETGSYPEWWPGARAAVGGGVELPFIRRRVAMPERERDGVGVHLVFGSGSLEWYLEAFEEGTIVNALLEVESTDRRLSTMRGNVRRGLVGLKRKLEGRP